MASRSRLPRRTILAGLSALPIAGCGPLPDVLIVPESGDIGVTEPVFVASSRRFEDGQFLDARAEALTLARYAVSIPPQRELGEVDPGRDRGRGVDLRTEFVATESNTYAAPAAFYAALQQEARRRDTREVMIFIHGYFNTLGTGLYRTAQIRYDFQVPGVAVHYAWPSAGHPLGYAYDRDSALFARDGLETLIRDIIGLGLNVVLIAHSLGSAVVMEVLRQMRIAGQDRVLNRVSGVILFSPDIDIDVFRSQASRIGALPQPFVIFTSQRDRALTISARITGLRERIGNLSTPEDVAEFDITLIDTSAFEGGVGDGLNHFAGATSPAVVQILRDVARVNTALERGVTEPAGVLPGTILMIQNATQVMLSPLARR